MSKTVIEKERKGELLTKFYGAPLAKTLGTSDKGFLVVTGKFTSDQKDMAGDIITRSATERALPEYKQWGNIRYMHLPQPVGRVLAIGEEDGLEWNEVKIEVIDEKASSEVENGLLTALSVGILIKWDDIDFLEDGGWVINDYSLAEISLVDHPANYDAKLDLGAMTKDFMNCVGDDGLMCAVKSFGFLPEAEKSIVKSPECRQEDESVEDCVERKIPEILEENEDMDQDQAIAIAYDMCEAACDDKTLDPQEGEEEQTMSKDKDTNIVEEVVEEIVEEEQLEEDKNLEAEVEDTPEEVVEEDKSVSEDEAPVVAEEIEQTPEEAIEGDVDKDLAEEEVDPIKDLAASINEVKELITQFFEVAQQVPAEAQEEQVEDEVVEVENEVTSLREEVDALKDQVGEMIELLATFNAPANRQAPVLPADNDEPDTEVEQEDKDLELDEPTSLRAAVRRYLETKR